MDEPGRLPEEHAATRPSTVLSLLRPRSGAPSAPPSRLTGKPPAGILERFATVTFIFVLLTYFVIVPANLKPELYETWVPSTLLYVVLDGYLVVRLAFLIRNNDSPTWSLVYKWLGLAVLLFFATDLVEYLRYTGVTGLPSGVTWALLSMLPLAAMTVARRVRAHRAPAVPEYHPDELTQIRLSSARIGLITAYALTVPILSALLSRMGALDPELDGARDLVVLWALFVLGGIAIAHHHLTSKENRLLEQAHRDSQEALLTERVEFTKKLDLQRAELLVARDRPPEDLAP